MKLKFFENQAFSRWICLMVIAILPWSTIWGQSEGENTVEELVRLGFENVRWAENESERIYTIENSTYKIQEVGIAKAVQTIQELGLPDNKRCKIIVTRQEIPEMSLTYEPLSKDTANLAKWQTSYDLADSWKEVKKEKKRNSSRYKVDILIYPSFSFQNMDLTKVYQVMLSLNPAIEVSFWPGMKLTGQIILPLIVDTQGYAAYSPLHKKVRPGFITLAQRFRLPFNIKGKATVGCFNQDQYGLDLQLFRPFKDERFSVEAQVGYTGWGYWDGFSLKYNDQYQWTWSAGANYYWPQYDVSFNLKGEQYLMGEKGVKFEMIRHFRYASVGFYAQKAKEAGIEIGQTHAECSGQIRDYGHDIEDMLKRAIASIKATHYLGCKYCVVHPLFVSGRVYDKKCKENFDAAVEFYKKLIPYLEEYDVYCCVENMWNCDPVYMNICSTILSHAQEMVDMCNVLGDRFKICLDVGHALLTQDDPAEMVRICGDKLVCLHTHDNDGFSDLHAFPFNKSAAPYATRWKPMRCDWNAFMKALDEVNYRGNLNFEVGVPGPPELEAATHKYLVAIAKYLISLRTVQY